MVLAPENTWWRVAPEQLGNRDYPSAAALACAIGDALNRELRERARAAQRPAPRSAATRSSISASICGMPPAEAMSVV